MTGEQRPLTLAPASILVACCLVWGFNQALVKWTYLGISPLLSATFRSAIAVVALLIYCRLARLRLIPESLPFIHFVIMALFFCAEFILLFIGVDLTMASRGSVFLYSQPFFTAALAHLFIPGDRLNAWRGAGLVISFAGVVVVLWDRPSGGEASLLGDVLCIGAGLAWAATNVFYRRVVAGRASQQQALFWEVALSIPILAAATYLLEEPYFVPSAGVIASLLYQAIIVVAVTYLILFWLINTYRVSTLGAFTFLAPIFGVFFAVILLGESLSSSLLVGLVLVSAGVYLVNRH